MQTVLMHLYIAPVKNPRFMFDMTQSREAKALLMPKSESGVIDAHITMEPVREGRKGSPVGTQNGEAGV